MPMREECKHFESRSYAQGDTVRRCKLDLAPEAPWRCPSECPKYERRLADVGWQHGSLVRRPLPPEPAGMDDGALAALLGETADIVNAASAQVLADMEADAKRRRGWRRLLPRRRV
jgi:hypothetical protein